ncbi:MAG: hypothetical protein GTN62_05925 [Gemmatimonadales bacterium]|nr:hypothetical protein [Gemmatimonadales bacterium]NIN11035.1 hypothetical protein [Gemmatimonadales bacterium]NIN49632.1 hypothetical protein [Gemmatimonadales bacterium]NIP07096.1 hypothetical protein [Gemmatimonadales bacterium]NIQ99487.1 hypothetical protein [Gemmatimonadales bacterium]
MVDPALALLVFALVVTGLVGLLWPRRGLVARLSKLVRPTWRTRLEDALKRLYDAEYSVKPCSLESLAGALEISRTRAVKLVAHLELVGLVRSAGPALALTDRGRAEALRIVRSHRLWERYLADRTGVSPADWHDDAERREHTMSPGVVEELASAMGHPLYDPHGDPIPTARGDLPPQSGIALTALRPGQQATVVHLEDEPREVYEQIVAAGLAPRTQVQMLDATPQRLRFTADGHQRVLKPVVATNVTVAPLPAEAVPHRPLETLSDLHPGESASVIEIAPACQGSHRRRLLDLGLVPGTVVRAELRGAFREPVAYRIRGALIALRAQQADWVRIERRSPTGAE